MGDIERLVPRGLRQINALLFVGRSPPPPVRSGIACAKDASNLPLMTMLTLPRRVNQGQPNHATQCRLSGGRFG